MCIGASMREKPDLKRRKTDDFEIPTNPKKICSESKQLIICLKCGEYNLLKNAQNDNHVCYAESVNVSNIEKCIKMLHDVLPKIVSPSSVEPTPVSVEQPPPPPPMPPPPPVFDNTAKVVLTKGKKQLAKKRVFQEELFQAIALVSFFFFYLML